MFASEKLSNLGITKSATVVLAVNTSSASSEYTIGDKTESDIYIGIVIGSEIFSIGSLIEENKVKI